MKANRPVVEGSRTVAGERRLLVKESLEYLLDVKAIQEREQQEGILDCFLEHL